MSYCICPNLPDEEQSQLIDNFIQSLRSDTDAGLTSWNLLKLQAMYRSISDVATVEEFKQTVATTIPFRGGPCPRSLKCCAGCVRQCKYRCIQDCLNRAHMWKQTVIHSETPSKALTLAVASIEAAKDLETISWAVGDILSQKTNSTLKEYMKNAGLRPEENPYKLDYAPQFEVRISEKTGKAHRVVSNEAGAYKLRPWPESGLCPFCLPGVTHSRKIPGRDK